MSEDETRTAAPADLAQALHDLRFEIKRGDLTSLYVITQRLEDLEFAAVIASERGAAREQ